MFPLEEVMFNGADIMEKIQHQGNLGRGFSGADKAGGSCSFKRCISCSLCSGESSCWLFSTHPHAPSPWVSQYPTARPHCLVAQTLLTVVRIPDSGACYPDVLAVYKWSNSDSLCVYKTQKGTLKKTKKLHDGRLAFE